MNGGENHTDTAVPVIMYTPKGPIIEGERGPFLTTRLMLRELVNARDLIWRLFIRDFSAKYRQSVLGIVWAFLMPLVTVGMFVGMNRAGVLKIQGVGIPYPLYAILGLSIWNLFSVGIPACSNAVVSAGNMVIKINFPKVALVLAASFQGIVEFMIRILLLVVVFAWFGVAPDPLGLVLGLLALLPLYFLMVGIGLVLSLVTTVIRDVGSALNLALTGLMLLTPILYPIQGNNLLARVNVWNPLNYLVNVPRDLILQGHSPLINGFLITSIISLLIFYFGWKLFYLAQTKIAERV